MYNAIFDLYAFTLTAVRSTRGRRYKQRCFHRTQMRNLIEIAVVCSPLSDVVTICKRAVRPKQDGSRSYRSRVQEISYLSRMSVCTYFCTFECLFLCRSAYLYLFCVTIGWSVCMSFGMNAR